MRPRMECVNLIVQLPIVCRTETFNGVIGRAKQLAAARSQPHVFAALERWQEMGYGMFVHEMEEAIEGLPYHDAEALRLVVVELNQLKPEPPQPKGFGVAYPNEGNKNHMPNIAVFAPWIYLAAGFALGLALGVIYRLF